MRTDDRYEFCDITAEKMWLKFKEELDTDLFFIQEQCRQQDGCRSTSRMARQYIEVSMFRQIHFWQTEEHDQFALYIRLIP